MYSFLITLTTGCRSFSFNVAGQRTVPHDENTAYILVYVHRGGLYLFDECDKNPQKTNYAGGDPTTCTTTTK